MVNLDRPLQLPQHLLAVLHAHACPDDGWHGCFDGRNVLLLLRDVPGGMSGRHEPTKKLQSMQEMGQICPWALYI